jgi:sarcosine oxidase delta subunit
MEALFVQKLGIDQDQVEGLAAQRQQQRGLVQETFTMKINACKRFLNLVESCVTTNVACDTHLLLLNGAAGNFAYSGLPQNKKAVTVRK